MNVRNKYYFNSEIWDAPEIVDSEGNVIDSLYVSNNMYSWMVIHGKVYLSFETSHYGAIEVALMDIHHLDSVEQIEKKFGEQIDDICQDVRYSKTNECEGRFWRKYNLIEITGGQFTDNYAQQICIELGVNINNVYIVGAHQDGTPYDYYPIIKYKRTMKLTEQDLRNIIREMLQEKSVSKSQQRFFGMVDAYKKGELDDDEVSSSVKDAADGMSMKQVKDFAKTKHKGLPNHVDESTFQDLNDMDNYSGEYSRGDRYDIYIDGQLEYHDVPEEAVDRICASWERKPYDVDIDVKRLNESCESKIKINENILRQIVRESLEEISNDTADWAYMRAMQDTNVLPYGSPKRVRRDAQVKNLKKLRNDKLGFDPDAMMSTMRQQGTSGDPSIDRKWATWQQNHIDRKNGNRVYDKERGRWITKISESELIEMIRESVQTELVKTLGKYTLGKVTSKEANKAIMDLANSTNTK